jgi:hypothetical protein
MRAAFALVGVLVAGASSADEPPALADLLAQTGKYVRGLQQDFATVISDETYTQRERFSEQRSGKEKTSTAERTMRSEMLFLWLPQEREWLAVRNVLSVDRKAVPDSKTRLDQMLANPEPDAIARFRNLRDEGARFNIGRLRRNLSDPMLPLKFIDPAYQPRFEFRYEGADVVNGVGVWKVALTERQQRPTMIQVDEHDVPSAGIVWMTSSGIVMRTQLTLTDPKTLVNVSMLVSYGRDAKLGGWVPIRMDEEYTQHVDEASAAPLLAQATGDQTPTRRRFALDHPFHEAISCSATYTNYRRFETAARILAPK